MASEAVPSTDHRGWLPSSFVAIGEDDQGRRRAYAPAEIFEKVEGCGVRPVNVLEDEHCRRPAVLQFA
jgi:hypothetical protein